MNKQAGNWEVSLCELTLKSGSVQVGKEAELRHLFLLNFSYFCLSDLKRTLM